MKKFSVFVCLALTAIVFLGGCVSQPQNQVNGEGVPEPSREELEPEETEDPQDFEPVPEPEPEENPQTEEPAPEPPPMNSFRNDPEIPSEAERALLPDCEGKFFSVRPVDLENVTEISPLGNIAPPGHTFPTEHAFFHFSPGGSSTNTFELVAPSDIFVTSLWQQFGMGQDPEDDTIWFALCKDVIGYFNHVKELSPEMKKIISDSGCEGKPHVGPNACMIQVIEPVSAGTVLGRVGRLQGNFDFGLIDLRKRHVFANPLRYSTRTLFIQCPFEYYDETTKQEFFELIERNDEGQCGKSAQDVPGTLKGNWFFDETTDSISQWTNYLAFVNDNQRPEIQVVSIGGVVADAGKLEFSPQSTGQINREFEDVLPDGKIYCYESPNFSGKIIVQMENETAIKVEHKTGNCTSNEIFSSPKNYER